MRRGRWQSTAYVRTSTNKQDEENQRHAILSYVHEKDMGKVTFTREQVSGKKSWKERGIKKIIDHLQPGDTLIISEVPRPRSSMMDIMEILAELLRKEVKVYALKGNYELADNIQSKVIAFAFSIASEIERDLISQQRPSSCPQESRGEDLGPTGGKKVQQARRT